jgi:hypothetical protein
MAHNTENFDNTGKGAVLDKCPCIPFEGLVAVTALNGTDHAWICCKTGPDLLKIRNEVGRP